MDKIFQPHFLKNSPSTICDQIMYLVKNSNLNFELHETPFSLNLNLKKSLAQHWKKADNPDQNTLFSQSNLPQQVNDPVHQLHPNQPYPHQGHNSQPNLSQSHHQQSHPHQPRPHQAHLQTPHLNQYHPQQPHTHQSHPHQPHDQLHNMPSVCQTPQSSDYTPWQNQEKLVNNFSQLQPLVPQHQIYNSATLDSTIKSEPEEISKEYLQEFAELELSHRNLLKESKELQVKHSKEILVKLRKLSWQK